MKMKKFITYIGILVFGLKFCFSQNIEIAKTMKFGETFDYWTKWDPNEESGPGFSQLLVSVNNEILILPTGNNYIYKASSFTSDFEKLDIQPKGLDRYFIISQIKGGYLAGYMDVVYANYQVSSNSYSFYLNRNGNTEIVTFDLNNDEAGGVFYFTANNLITEVAGRNIVSIEIFSDGENKVRGIDETKAWFESGKGEELGFSQKISSKSGKVLHNYFGDIAIDTVSEYYKNNFGELRLKSDKYKDIHKMNETSYSSFAKDGKGLVYYQMLEDENGLYNSDHPGKNIKFSIAVLDIWTMQVYFYEDYAANEWNPPRNSEGKVIGSYAWTVAPDGNIYFADADTDKGEYQIKRIPNRWYKDMGMEGRTIGQMNANHIPLAKEASAAAQNDGYCFENDFVWVKETKGAWSRIQKIDGRTGWVESKYIDIE